MPHAPGTRWRIGERVLELERPIAVGIVNVTDDSMFPGARSGSPEQAVEDGVRLAAEGFDVVDVGAVAARSGPPVPAAAEAGKLIPAIEGLAERLAIPISVDTFSPEVARLAVEAGASIVNDISGGADPEMLELAAQSGGGLVLMHIEGPPRIDRAGGDYGDVVGHLRDFFSRRIEAATAAGVDREQLALDPGLDFDLSTDQDLEILRRLGELADLGCPLFMALSRKDFLGAVLAGSWEGRLEPDRRGPATSAATALAVLGGAQVHRLHDPEALQAMRMAGAIASSGSSQG